MKTSSHLPPVCVCLQHRYQMASVRILCSARFSPSNCLKHLLENVALVCVASPAQTGCNTQNLNLVGLAHGGRPSTARGETPRWNQKHGTRQTAATAAVSRIVLSDRFSPRIWLIQKISLNPGFILFYKLWNSKVNIIIWWQTSKLIQINPGPMLEQIHPGATRLPFYLQLYNLCVKYCHVRESQLNTQLKWPVPPCLKCLQTAPSSLLSAYWSLNETLADLL